MKNAVIIVECNPTHQGHKYIIEKTKEVADSVTLIMSGNFVQRGLPAVTDFSKRTADAIKAGADLVLLYPCRYATSIAESFAKNAVRIAEGLNVFDYLSFGSECGEIGLLNNAADYLLKYDEQFSKEIKNYIAEGKTYPAAISLAAKSADIDISENVLSGGNNILGIEYIKAIKKLGSAIEPITFKRKSFDGEGCASIIRTRIRADVCADDLSLLLFDRIGHAKKASDLEVYEGINEVFANAIFAAAKNAATFTELHDAINTKDKTRSSCQRALLHIALDLKKRDDEPVFT